jgi:hypothetical protein
MIGTTEKLKFRALKRQLDQEKGPLTFLALVKRDDESGTWDLVISAPWIGGDITGAIRFVAEKLKQHFAPHEMRSLAAIVPLSADNPFIKAAEEVTGKHNGEPIELDSRVVNGVTLPQMFVMEASGEAQLFGSGKLEASGEFKPA